MDLKKTAIALLACALVFAPSAAGATTSDQTAVMAVVNEYIDGFNKANLKEMTSTCEPSASLIDDFAPHIWTGANACANWFKGFAAWAKANRYTNNTVIAGKPWQLMIDGDHAYVVLPAKYTWLQDGRPGQLLGSVYTLVLVKAKTGWLITGWTWADGPG
jgi:hypothetical protein